MTNPLSPAAAKVLDAIDGIASPQWIAEATLRTVANDWRVDTEFIGGIEYIRTTTLKTIAAELEANAQ